MARTGPGDDDLDRRAGEVREPDLVAGRRRDGETLNLPRPGDREAREPGTLQARHAPQNVEDRIETAAVVVEGLREIRPCGDCARRADGPPSAMADAPPSAKRAK